MQQDFRVVQESPLGPDRWADLALHIEAEEHQQRIGEGLLVGIGLTYTGPDPLAVLNPFAAVQFQLLDAAGYPLRIPRSPSSLRSRPDENWRLESAVPIVDVSVRGNSASVDALNQRELTLSRGDSWKVTFGIDRLSGDDQEAVAIPDGVYRVRCVTTLISVDEPRDVRIVQSPLVEVDFARQTPASGH